MPVSPPRVADPGLVRFDLLPPKEAVEFFRQKKYHLGFDWRDTVPEMHKTSFTMAKIMSMAVLKTIRSEFNKGLKQGLPPRQVIAELKPRLAARGWWGIKEVVDPQTGDVTTIDVNPHRIKRAFVNNMATAHSEGKWQRIQDNKDFFPFADYHGCNSAENREIHCGWDGTVVSVDDPWLIRHFPIKEFNCKCWAGLLTRKQAEARGISPAPTEKWRTWKNERTGKTKRVPEGVHPAFNYKPGGWRQNVEKYATEQLEELPEALKNAVKGLTTPRFPWRQDLPESPWHNAAFVDAPDSLREVVARVGPLNSLRTETGLSYHQMGEIVMNAEYTVDSERALGVWRHEFGHFIDFSLRTRFMFRSQMPDFTNAMKSDAKNMLAMSGRNKTREKILIPAYEEAAKLVAKNGEAYLSDGFAALGMAWDDVKSAIKKHSTWDALPDMNLQYSRLLVAIREGDAQRLLNVLEGRDLGSTIKDYGGLIKAVKKGMLGKLSDLFSAATLKEIEGVGSHSLKYYQERPAFGQQAESWANLTALLGDGNPFWAEILSRFTPKMLNIYQEVIRG